MSFENDHDPIITRTFRTLPENTSYSTTKNVPHLYFCEASEDGICCQSEASHVYPTSEGVERHLCDYHFYKLLRIIYAWHLIRRETRGAA